jgi:signal peptidase I
VLLLAFINKKSRNPKEKKKEEKLRWDRALLLYLHDMVYLLATVVIVLLLIFRVVIVSGSSMYDSLIHGDLLLLLSNTFYAEPEYGDIIVLSTESFDNGTPIVKRVIATEGQTVDIDFEAGIVYVDGVALDEPYTHTPTTTSGGTQFPLTVEAGCIFVLGDNRNESRDSRYPEIGQVDKREVLGKAILLMMPGSGKYGTEFDLERIGVIK